MRQLHPVSFHERFVASGTYVWSQAGAPTGDVEHWTIHEPGQGAWTLRADYDGRAGSGTSWLFEGFYDRARRRLDRFDVSLYGAQHTDAKFVLTDVEAQISLRVDGTTKDRLDLPLTPDAMPVAPALVGAYPWLPAFAASETRTVFVPDLDLAAGRVLGGDARQWTVEPRGHETVALATAELEARVFVVRTPDAVATVWLDTHDILLRYESSAGRAAHLTQYVHRPETTS